MEIRDGFIVGIFNYCDRWCEACAFTSRCRLFADVAETEASLDPNLQPVVDAPVLPRRAPPREHLAIEKRATRYCFQVHPWLQNRRYEPLNPDDPCAVIGWFHTLIPPKVHRAISGLAEDDEGRDCPADHDGSAKVALLGIERSHAAWLALIERGAVSDAEAAPFIADLVWLGEALEQVFPKARAFVRPALDEPDEVAMLLAQERRAG